MKKKMPITKLLAHIMHQENYVILTGKSFHFQLVRKQSLCFYYSVKLHVLLVKQSNGSYLMRFPSMLTLLLFILLVFKNCVNVFLRCNVSCSLIKKCFFLTKCIFTECKWSITDEGKFKCLKVAYKLCIQCVRASLSKFYRARFFALNTYRTQFSG